MLNNNIFYVSVTSTSRQVKLSLGNKSDRVLVYAVDNITVYTYNENGTILNKFSNHKRGISFACFSLDDQFIITIDLIGIVKKFHLDTGKEVWSSKNKRSIGFMNWSARDVLISNIEFLSKDEFIIIRNSEIIKYSYSNGVELERLDTRMNKYEDFQIFDTSIHTRKKWLLTSNISLRNNANRHTIKLWRLNTEAHLNLYGWKNNKETFVHFISNNSFIVISGSQINVYNIKGEIVFSRNNAEVIYKSDVSHDGKYLALAGRYEIFIWDLEKMLLIKKISSVVQGISSTYDINVNIIDDIKFSSSSDLLYCLSKSQIKIYNDYAD